MTEQEWAIAMTGELVRSGIVDDQDREGAQLICHKVVCMALRSQLDCTASELYRTAKHIKDGHERGDPVTMIESHAQLLSWRARKIDKSMTDVQNTQDLHHDLLLSVKDIVLDMLATWKDDNHLFVAEQQVKKQRAIAEVKKMTPIGKEIIRQMMEQVDDDDEK